MTEKPTRQIEEDPLVPRPELRDITSLDDLPKALDYDPIPGDESKPGDHLFIHETEGSYDIMMCIRDDIGRIAGKPQSEWETILWISPVQKGISSRPERLPPFNLQINAAKQFLSHFKGIITDRQNIDPAKLDQDACQKLAEAIAVIQDSGAFEYFSRLDESTIPSLAYIKKEGGIETFLEAVRNSVDISREDVVREIQSEIAKYGSEDKPAPEDITTPQLEKLLTSWSLVHPYADLPAAVAHLQWAFDVKTIFVDAGITDHAHLVSTARELTEVFDMVIALQKEPDYAEDETLKSLKADIESKLQKIREDYSVDGDWEESSATSG